MTALRFLSDDPDAAGLRASIQSAVLAYRKQKRYYSDIYQSTPDGELQYVDIVMEGGGVLGLALVGYIYALESAGLRFLSIGGTSAGSILALLLMACDDREKAKSGMLLDIISKMDMASFVDGDAPARDLSIFIARGNLQKKPIQLLWHTLWVLKQIRDKLGLNPGNEFSEWLHGHLRRFGTPTLGKLKRRINRIPRGLRNRVTNRPVRTIPCDLAIVAADVTTETKAVFPAMADMYWPSPEEISPAEFVRASMSIPLFFRPYKVGGIRRIPDVESIWKTRASYDAEVPDEVLFADGGTMSNFPIGIFHEPGVPAAPTLGIKLGARSRSVQTTENIFDYGVNLFDAIRHFSDFDFISKNPDYTQLIGHIDTSKHHWLNFFMGDAEKKELFLEGMQAGFKFLQTFDWASYKRTRKKRISG